jgi:protein SCO1/2
VLKGYAAARGIDTRTFSFLTGPETAVRDLLTQFGVIAEKGDNIWKHTLATLLIDRDGKIAHRVDGSTWEPDEFLRRL